MKFFLQKKESVICIGPIKRAQAKNITINRKRHSHFYETTTQRFRRDNNFFKPKKDCSESKPTKRADRESFGFAQ